MFGQTFTFLGASHDLILTYYTREKENNETVTVPRLSFFPTRVLTTPGDMALASTFDIPGQQSHRKAGF